jgi:hypothetical protein
MKHYTIGDTFYSLENVRKINLNRQTNKIVITYTDGTYERIKNSNEKLANLNFKMIVSNLCTNS